MCDRSGMAFKLDNSAPNASSKLPRMILYPVSDQPDMKSENFCR